ncbi:unnamed protein product [Urochloa humidicola]
MALSGVAIAVPGLDELVLTSPSHPAPFRSSSAPPRAASPPLLRGGAAGENYSSTPVHEPIPPAPHAGLVPEAGGRSGVCPQQENYMTTPISMVGSNNEDFKELTKRLRHE